MARYNEKIVYVFDFEGNLIDEAPYVSECGRRYGIKKGAIFGCLKRGNCYRYTYFFSYQKTFKPDISKGRHHVLRSGVSGGSFWEYKTTKGLHDLYSKQELD